MYSSRFGAGRKPEQVTYWKRYRGVFSADALIQLRIDACADNEYYGSIPALAAELDLEFNHACRVVRKLIQAGNVERLSAVRGGKVRNILRLSEKLAARGLAGGDDDEPTADSPVAELPVVDPPVLDARVIDPAPVQPAAYTTTFGATHAELFASVSDICAEKMPVQPQMLLTDYASATGLGQCLQQALCASAASNKFTDGALLALAALPAGGKERKHLAAIITCAVLEALNAQHTVSTAKVTNPTGLLRSLIRKTDWGKLRAVIDAELASK